MEQMQQLSTQLEVTEQVTFLGAVPPEKTRAYMEKANISLFTSDRLEGWGAVVNEAMGSGCALVASAAAGSPPFLIKSKVNGELFDIDDPLDFYEKVYKLIVDTEYRLSLAKNAYYTAQQLWTPEHAAKSFILLADSILKGRPQPSEQGPCSVAPVLADGWIKKGFSNV